MKNIKKIKQELKINNQETETLRKFNKIQIQAVPDKEE